MTSTDHGGPPTPDPSPALPVGKLDARVLADLLCRLPADPGVLVGAGVGCDVAVVDPGAGPLLLLKSDPVTFATDEIGHYAVTVNANDIATSGGVPRWFMATVLMPERRTSVETVSQVFEQLRRACAGYGVTLVGGHTEITHGLDRPIVAGTMVGQVPRDRLVTNAGAKVGDRLLVTKSIAIEGASIIGREKRGELLRMGIPAATVNRCADLLHAPGIGVLRDAQAICRVVKPHAMHDPTEGGLATGLWEMAQASRVGLQVERDKVPVLPEVRVLCDRFGLDPLGLIASGALLVAVAPEDEAAAIAACRCEGIDCSRIGEVVEEGAGCTMHWCGEVVPLPRYDQDEIGKLFST